MIFSSDGVEQVQGCGIGFRGNQLVGGRGVQPRLGPITEGLLLSSRGSTRTICDPLARVVPIRALNACVLCRIVTSGALSREVARRAPFEGAR